MMPDEVVTGELPCRSCGYDLRGRRADDVCPECQSLVSRSMGRGDSFGSAEPKWVRGLWRGTGLTLIGVVGSAVLAVGISIGYGLSGVLGGGVPLVLSIVGGLTTIVITLVLVGGAWLLTALDPGRGQEGAGFSLRVAARYSMVAQLIVAPYQMLWMNQGTALAETEHVTALVAGGAVVGMIGIAGWLLFLLYLGQLYGRIGRKGRVRQARFLAWVIAVVTLIMATSGNILFFGMATGAFPQAAGAGAGGRPSVLFIVLGLTSFVGFAAWIALQIWLSVVLLLVRGQLNRLTQESEAHWNESAVA